MVNSQSYHAGLVSERYPSGIPAVGEPIDLLIEKHYQDNVGYIVEEQADGSLPPVGTVFFVSVVLRSAAAYYAVTCRHVVMGSLRKFIRMNLKAGGFTDIPCPLDRWTLSADSDVAVTRLAGDPAVRFWPYQIWSLKDYVGADLMAGRDVFMTGLFAPHPGVNSVEALVRTGRVAREQTNVTVTVDLETEEKRDVEAHLVQALSWGGESGSPVFAYDPKPDFPLDEIAKQLMEMMRGGAFGRKIKIQDNVRPYLVGLLHGHFRLTEDEESNAGIAIVIPVKKILETLSDPVLEADREAFAKAVDERLKGKTRPL